MNKTKIKIGVSSKKHGPIKKNKQIQRENLEDFLSEYNIDSEKLTIMKQVHGKRVSFVDSYVNIASDTDGIVTNKKNHYLGVITADCVPLLLFDKKNHVVGAVHAGYKGVLVGVVEEAIDVLVKKGAKQNEIEAIIGPSIGVCCYNIDEDRRGMFVSQFGENGVEYRDNSTYLNLPKIVKQILEKKRISSHNIFISDICTQCNSNEYFSFRAQQQNNFGTFISVIGME